VFCALQDQLASLGRHAQLTRCFSAVAELIVNLYKNVDEQFQLKETKAIFGV